MKELNDITHLNKLVVWPDNTWCLLEDLRFYTHMSDDYEIVYLTEDQYDAWVKTH
jgi:hypothetical protein